MQYIDIIKDFVSKRFFNQQIITDHRGVIMSSVPVHGTNGLESMEEIGSGCLTLSEELPQLL